VNCVSGSDGWTPAHMASFCGRFDCLQMLVKHHATVDSVDYDGNTPGAFTYIPQYTLLHSDFIPLAILIVKRETYHIQRA